MMGLGFFSESQQPLRNSDMEKVKRVNTDKTVLENRGERRGWKEKCWSLADQITQNEEM